MVAKAKREIERQNAIARQENKKVMEQARAQAKSLVTWSETYRNLIIDGFGVWNCDIAARQKTINIRANFKDGEGKVLDLDLISIINLSQNSIFHATPDNMLLVPGSDNMILAVSDNKLAYVSVEEYKKLNITATANEVTFIMKLVDEKDCNYEYIKSLLKR